MPRSAAAVVAPAAPLTWTPVRVGVPELPSVIQTRIASAARSDRRYRVTALSTGVPLACTCRGYEEGTKPAPYCRHMQIAWLDLHRDCDAHDCRF